ncbi:GP46-like surface antigen, putative [Bodo saltans]|uniref:GP46-like surface antigen, putative n=1 Tax=Bodo saltans TaxID=75058 RepID=A0A0S4KIF1_BODSA|nr:GP46-like surface antigen, putative [Bodo saltans]|eukprot:CUI14183.1 GP46-like surface antigen, putative [Bodo saltans]
MKCMKVLPCLIDIQRTIANRAEGERGRERGTKLTLTQRGMLLFPLLVAFIPIFCLSAPPANSMCTCQNASFNTLMDFYNATNGGRWYDRGGWGTPCTTWVGVTCSGGNVTQIYFYSNGLSGTLPNSMSNLTSLESISLQYNALSGTLPASWVLLCNLTTIDVSFNSLTGPLPESWASLPNLTALKLQYNSLNGTLPAAWANMSSLYQLYLTSNSLGGTLPASWASMSKMQYLYLQSNSLNGTLSGAWCAMLTLQSIDISYNKLSGVLPAQWGSMINIGSITLTSNSLNGALPDSWSSMSSLTALYLQYNSLTGALPASWANMSKMQYLYLQSNSLNGTLPAAWANMSKMQYLYLQSNSLNGTLPAAWANMSSLYQLYLSHNALTGSLPSLWINFSWLSTLDVSYNMLSGTVPSSWITNMSTLFGYSLRVILSSNCLSGVILAPPTLGRHVWLEICNTHLIAVSNSALTVYACASNANAIHCRNSNESSSLSSSVVPTRTTTTTATIDRSASNSLTLSGSHSQRATATTTATVSNSALSLSSSHSQTTNNDTTTSATLSESPPCGTPFSLETPYSYSSNDSSLVLCCSNDSSVCTTPKTALSVNDNVTNNTFSGGSKWIWSINVLGGDEVPIITCGSVEGVVRVPFCIPSSWRVLNVASNTSINNFSLEMRNASSSQQEHADMVTCGNATTHNAQFDSLLYGTTTMIAFDAVCIGGGGPVLVEVIVRWPLATTAPPTLTSPAVVGASSTSSIVGILSGGAAASSAASTAMLALLTCDAVPPINTVTYFVSVFFDLGLVAVALGNIGVVIAVGALQLVFVTLVHHRRMTAESISHTHRHPLLVDVYLEDSALCRFPALTVQLMGLLLPGSLLGAFGAILQHQPTTSTVVLCCIAVSCVVLAFALQVVVQRRVALPRAMFVQYTTVAVGTSFEKRFLFPAGRWEPMEVSQAFNPLIASMIPGYSQLLIVEMMLACLLGMVSGAFIGGICDSPLLAIVGALHFTYCVFLVVARPHRLPTDRVCVPVIHLLTGVVCVLRYNDPRDVDGNGVSSALQQLLSFVQVLSSLCTVVFHFCRESALRAGDQLRDDNEEELCCVKEEEGITPLMMVLPERASLDDDEQPRSPPCPAALDDIEDFDEVQTLYWDRDGNAKFPQNQSVTDGAKGSQKEIVHAPSSLAFVYAESTGSTEGYFIGSGGIDGHN